MADERIHEEGNTCLRVDESFVDIPLSEHEEQPQTLDSQQHAGLEHVAAAHSDDVSDVDNDHAPINHGINDLVVTSAAEIADAQADVDTHETASIIRVGSSHDDIQRPAVSVPDTTFGRGRSASYNSRDDCSKHLPDKMQGINNHSTEPAHHLDGQIAHTNQHPRDVSGSTIENIVAHYSIYEPELTNGPQGIEPVYGPNTVVNSFLPYPPIDDLPERPSASVQGVRPVDLRHSMYESQAVESPPPSSSVTDSQYLLDAEAQSRAISQVDIVYPQPINLARHRQIMENLEAYQSGGSDEEHGEPNNQEYDAYLRAQLQRDISHRLRDAAGARLSTSNDENETRRSYASARTRRRRLINVSIGPESTEEPVDKGKGVMQQSIEDDAQDIVSDDADWVTEETSDAGYNQKIDTKLELSSSGYKQAGSSLADYSDEGEANLDKFGSTDQILPYEPCGDTSKDAKYSTLLSHKKGDGQRGVKRLHDGRHRRESSHFRPHLLSRKGGNPNNKYREIDNDKRPERAGKFKFNFDGNSPPKYVFRDSISEFDVAGASTQVQVNYSRQPDQNEGRRYPARPVSPLSETDNLDEPTFPVSPCSSAGDARRDEAGPSQGPSAPRFTLFPTDRRERQLQLARREQEEERRRALSEQAPREPGLDPQNYSLYAAERQRQRDQYDQHSRRLHAAREVNQRQASQGSGVRPGTPYVAGPYDVQDFARHTEYTGSEVPKSGSVQSKFKFALVPIKAAQERARRLRESNTTNSSERGQSARANTETNSESIELQATRTQEPARPYFTSHDLSTTFTPTELESVDLEMGTPPARPQEAHMTPVRSGRRRTQSWLGFTHSPSTAGSPSVTMPLRHGCHQPSRLAESPSGPERQPRPRPGYIAPEDYVSDRTDRIRRRFFYFVLFLDVLPFLGILPKCGVFNEALTWATRGEVHRMTGRQRSISDRVLMIFSAIYFAVVIALGIYFGVTHKGQH
ncbi:hypothetical protein GGR50DRAFT_698669 [Xylaria sp. CBS 124048]|nr:hypothetical protein GGR50DRAFT_698669 [Xylaria sp. CBS 124048]